MLRCILDCSLLPLFLVQAEEFPSYACEDDTPGMPGYGPDGLPTFRPLIIAHRGASGMYPEHTALAYRKAAEQGADLIECDLALTRVNIFIIKNYFFHSLLKRMDTLYLLMTHG